MLEHQVRVVKEKEELDGRLVKLRDFIDHSPLFRTINDAERERLERQASIMRRYSEVLGERIEAFGENRIDG